MSLFLYGSCDFNDNILLIALGSGYGNLLACLLAENGRANGRTVGNTSLDRICLIASDDGVLLLLARRYLAEKNGRTEVNGGMIECGLLNHNGVKNYLLKLAYSAFDLGLLVFSLIVLRVLGKVTEGTCESKVLLDLVTLCVL